MDKMMSSKIGSVAVPLAAGAGAAFGGPQGARGMSTALQAIQQQQEFQEQQRLGEMFASEFEGGEPPDATDASVAGFRNPSSGEVERLRRLSSVLARSGDLRGAIQAMKAIGDLSAPIKVGGGDSLMSRTGDLLGTAPVADPFRIQGSGNQVINQATGDVNVTPFTEFEAARTGSLAESKIAVDQSSIGANEALVGQRNASADAARARAERSRRVTDSGKTDDPIKRKKELASTMKQVQDTLDMGDMPQGQREVLEKWLASLANEWNAIDEATGLMVPTVEDDDSTDEGVDEMIASHELGSMPQTGKEYDYDWDGNRLVPIR